MESLLTAFDLDRIFLARVNVSETFTGRQSSAVTPTRPVHLLPKDLLGSLDCCDWLGLGVGCFLFAYLPAFFTLDS